MPLDKQLVPIDFNESSDDTKSDPKVSGKYLRIENMFKKRTGELRKRFGFDAIPVSVFSGDTAIADDIYVSDFNKELVAITSNDIYSYSESDDKWKEIDDDFKLWAMDSIKTSIARNYVAAQIAISANYYLVVTSEIDQTFKYFTRYSIYDRVTNSVIVPETFLNQTADYPLLSVVSNGSYFIIVYTDGNFDINLKSIKLTDLSIINRTIASTCYSFFAICSTTDLYVYANDNGTGKLYRINPTTLAAVSDISAGTLTTSYGSSAMRLAFNGTNVVAYFCIYSTGNKRPSIGYYQQDLTQINAITAMTPIACSQTEMESFTGYLLSATSFTVWTSTADKTSVGAGIQQEIWNLTTNATVSSTFQYGWKTQGNVFYVNSVPYLIMSQNLLATISGYETYQANCFLLNLSSLYFEGLLSSSFFSGLNAGTPSNFSNGVAFDNEIYYPCIEQVDTVNKVVTIKNIYQDITELSIPTKTNNELIIPNLIPLSYTGTELIETNYSQYPVIAGYTNTGAGTGLTTGKTYSYYAIYSHVDRNGIKRRSAMSNVLTFAKTDGNIWSIQVYASSFNRNNQNVELYRTEGDGSIYYLTESRKDFSGSLVTFSQDNTSFGDSILVRNELIYTTGGVLESELPSSCSITKILRNRLFIARCSEPDRVYYSKELSANYAPELSRFNVIEFFDNEGSIIGCAELDEKLFFFKRDAIFYCFGELNNDLGQGQNVTPLRIPGNIGLTDYQAIAEFTDGIIFKSARGFYLIDRGLNISYIGAPVEYFNSVNITSSVLMTQYNQIRFTSTSGTCLVYDYFWKEWYVYTNILATSSTNWEGSFVFAKSNGTFFKENSASWQDVSTPIVSKVLTSWLDVSGVQGYQRFYRGLILGEYRGTHTLKVSVATDYKPYYDEQFNMATSVLTGTVTNDASYYGDYATGSTDSVYQFQFRPKNQK